MYIDSYGNATTNINKELFNKIGMEEILKYYMEKKRKKSQKL